MDEWTAFVSDRLDEREAVARRNTGGSGLHDTDWSTSPGWPDYQTYSGDDLDAAGDYIDCFRPLRALREVAALRAILAEHHPTDWTAYGEHMCSRCACDDDEPHDELHHWMPWPCPTARATASIWSDHPDYPGTGQ